MYKSFVSLRYSICRSIRKRYPMHVLWRQRTDRYRRRFLRDRCSLLNPSRRCHPALPDHGEPQRLPTSATVSSAGAIHRAVRSSNIRDRSSLPRNSRKHPKHKVYLPSTRRYLRSCNRCYRRRPSLLRRHRRRKIRRHRRCFCRRLCTEVSA